ncbi:MAG TPA: TonB-dependent receptor, partial [Longimicrobiales bacterium]|nr:TonB-dependent receptor [Longimicrobiales bacterium]
LDTRIDVFQLYSDNPEDPVVAPGYVSWNRDRGIRLIERARLALGPGARLHLTAALDHTRQRSFAQAPKIRGAMPFTDRLTEGRATGRYIGGTYLAPVHLEGDPWLVYTRLEGELQGDLLDFGHEVRAGVEWRREWNDGSGYQFDIEFPPQVRFNGVQGFDRPRPFSDIPALATAALYLDDRMSRPVLGEGLLNVQAGARLDLLHERGHWFSGIRDALLQPRLNVELAPRQWLRLRGGIGTTAKLPNLGQLHPGPQYYDVVNVNRFSNDPAERLAVLTTFIRDPTNPDLGYARANKAEAGFELDLGPSASVGVVAFRDGVHGAVGISPEPRFLLRDIYELTDSVEGNGVPPRIIEPPVRADTVPILVDRPANNLRLLSEGLELTASFPEIPRLRTRVQVQGAWIRSEFHKDDIDFSHPFSDFQLDGRDPRTPYWEAITRLGERALLTYRLVHHQPELGLVVTATVQQTLKLDRHDVGGTDTLSWAGYLTRDGRLIPVPREERGQAQYRDLRVGRSGLSEPRPAPSDWFLNLQVSKTLPLDGRLSFYAFNALDRRGRFPTSTNNGLVFPPMRFGLELSAPAAVLERLVP